MSTLAGSLRYKIQKKREDLERNYQTELGLVELCESLGLEPYIVYNHGIYGNQGGLGFKFESVNKTIQILKKLPARRCVTWNGGGIRYDIPKPHHLVKLGHWDNYEHCGIVFTTQRIGKNELRWSAIKDGRLFSVQIEMPLYLVGNGGYSTSGGYSTTTFNTKKGLLAALRNERDSNE